MTKQRTYKIQMPGKVAEALTEWNINPPFKGYSTDKAALLLSIVSTHQRKDDNGNIYAQLKMEFLRNVVYNADKYIRLFLDFNIIRRLGGFVPKEQAYRYQFTPEFQSPYVTTDLQNKSLLNKITKASTKKGRSDSRYYPEQKRQLKTMTVDYDAAIDLIKNTYPDNSDIEKYNFAIGAVTRIVNEPPYLVRDDSGHRVHTPLTNLPKFLRSEIQINGKYLSGLDIGNSQLYFSLKILTDPEGAKDFFPGKFPLIMLKCLRLSQQQDVAKFVLLVQQAKLYKFLESEFINAGLKIEVVDPVKVSDDTKRRIFTVLFEENHLTSKAKKLFQRCFPNVDKAFSLLRMAKYTDFVNVLARMESYAVNDMIIARLNREHPDMVAQQIYDNVVTSIVTDDMETARRVMTEELTKFIGCPPVLRTENFRPAALFNNYSSLLRVKKGSREERGEESTI